jgi:ribonuclease VapC
MVLDTSALIAIIFSENEREDFLQLAATTVQVSMSAASVYEASVVTVTKKRNPQAVLLVDRFLNELEVEVIPFDSEGVREARTAYLRYGKDHHPARLNLADCFSYALAKLRDVPLLFKGDDFTKTDITPAWRPRS